MGDKLLLEAARAIESWSKTLWWGCSYPDGDQRKHIRGRSQWSQAERDEYDNMRRIAKQLRERAAIAHERA